MVGADFGIRLYFQVLSTLQSGQRITYGRVHICLSVCHVFRTEYQTCSARVDWGGEGGCTVPTGF
jgi:hypothetical protein